MHRAQQKWIHEKAQFDQFMDYMNQTDVIDDDIQLDIINIDKQFAGDDYQGIEPIKLKYSDTTAQFIFDNSLYPIDNILEGITVRDLNMIKAVEQRKKECFEPEDPLIKEKCEGTLKKAEEDLKEK